MQLADIRSMATRLATFLPRFAALTAVALLSTATLTFAAAKQQSSASGRPAAAPAVAALVVPNVREKAYVFAKGILEEAGFAWRVEGGTQGFAANTVVSQRPAAGSQVLDTGMPTVVLHLTSNPSYAQTGEPENAAPYAGTRIRFPGTPAPRVRRVAPKPTPAPRVQRPRPAKAKPAQHRFRPEPKATPKPKPKPKRVHRVARPPAFAVAGAPKEPLDEMPLTDRARLLSRWVAAHPTVSNANVRHWLFQHAWIVTGSKFGWWRGAEALRTLIEVDQRVQAQWGVGDRSESLARAALAEVEAKAR
jgi:PASTA domain-containing protein